MRNGNVIFAAMLAMMPLGPGAPTLSSGGSKVSSRGGQGGPGDYRRLRAEDRNLIGSSTTIRPICGKAQAAIEGASHLTSCSAC